MPTIPFSQELADRVLGVIGDQPSLEQKRMFGGMAYMLRGNLACGVIEDDLIVRVPKEDYPRVLGRPHVREMDYSGRAMRGWVVVGPGGTDTDAGLSEWVRCGASTALSLPAK